MYLDVISSLWNFKLLEIFIKRIKWIKWIHSLKYYNKYFSIISHIFYTLHVNIYSSFKIIDSTKKQITFHFLHSSNVRRNYANLRHIFARRDQTFYDAIKRTSTNVKLISNIISPIQYQFQFQSISKVSKYLISSPKSFQYTKPGRAISVNVHIPADDCRRSLWNYCVFADQGKGRSREKRAKGKEGGNKGDEGKRATATVNETETKRNETSERGVPVVADP